MSKTAWDSEIEWQKEAMEFGWRDWVRLRRVMATPLVDKDGRVYMCAIGPDAATLAFTCGEPAATDSWNCVFGDLGSEDDDYSSVYARFGWATLEAMGNLPEFGGF